jgi:hypothetical protein
MMLTINHAVNPAVDRLHKLLSLALDPAATDEEAQNAARHFVMQARRLKLTVAALAEALGNERTESAMASRSPIIAPWPIRSCAGRSRTC